MCKEKSAVIKNIIWYSILGISFTGFIVLSAGFIKAMKVTSNAKAVSDYKTVNINKAIRTSSALVRENTNVIKITVLGDSIARGTGDEKGKGFSGYIPFYFGNLTPKEISAENAEHGRIQADFEDDCEVC